MRVKHPTISISRFLISTFNVILWCALAVFVWSWAAFLIQSLRFLPDGFHCGCKAVRLFLSFLVAFFLATVALVPGKAAFAFEPLAFGASSFPLLSKQRISAWLEANTGLPVDQYSVAPEDLNRDGIAEYILKPLKCYDSNGFCPFLILADTSAGIITLGTISAKSLALGDSYHGGVQDILAFRSNNNDYEYDIFVWDPPGKSYIVSGGLKDGNGS